MSDINVLKNSIEGIFSIKCSDNCKFICETSSKALAEIIKEKLQRASAVLCYYFFTNSGLYFKGERAYKSDMITELGENITDISKGYMAIKIANHPNAQIESFAFGVVDLTKGCIKKYVRRLYVEKMLNYLPTLIWLICKNIL